MSLSKAVGLEGGAISASADRIHALEALSGTSIFTAALQPPTASTANMIIQTMDMSPQIMDSYLRKSHALRESLISEGLTINETPSYITSVHVGKDTVAERIRLDLEGLGFCAPIFRYPAVKPNQALIRLILHRNHTPEDVARFIEALKSLMKEHG